jgi:hypothetical protein
MAALLNSLTSKGPLNRAHTYKAAVVTTARPDATPTTATRTSVQVETAASTTATVAGTTFDVPLDTRVKGRASPAGARRPRAGRWSIGIVRSFAAASPAGDDAAS